MPSQIRAEMAANVWKVLVAKGDQVAIGDPIVILESMKMEIPIPSETSGVVVDIYVEEGAVVQEDQLIAAID